MLSNWERHFLEYFEQKYNAKYFKVFNNKHLVYQTEVALYTIYKRKLTCQPKPGELTYTGMFKILRENTWYYIPELLKN